MNTDKLNTMIDDENNIFNLRIKENGTSYEKHNNVCKIYFSSFGYRIDMISGLWWYYRIIFLSRYNIINIVK